MEKGQERGKVTGYIVAAAISLLVGGGHIPWLVDFTLICVIALLLGQLVYSRNGGSVSAGIACALACTVLQWVVITPLVLEPLLRATTGTFDSLDTLFMTPFVFVIGLVLGVIVGKNGLLGFPDKKERPNV